MLSHLIPLLNCIFILSLVPLFHPRLGVEARPSLPQAHSKRQQIYDTNVIHIDENAANHNEEFFSYVTRPDIIAPRWDIKFYDKKALAPGYWVQAVYEKFKQGKDENYDWIGPYIYDGEGELVWSGVPYFRGYNVKDFHVVNVNGEQMLSGLYGDKSDAIILNNSYEVHKELPLKRNNHHGFNTVYNGTRALTMTINMKRASREESATIGFDGRCKAAYPGFEEFDTTTWQKTFEWSGKDYMHLDESFIEGSCNRLYDFIHANSVDKFPDGDYLLSGRHSDTIYKISHIDGSIVWRLASGGKYTDFEFADHFSGQHHGRCVSQNSTHTVISMLDNAIRPGEPHITNDQSRGMIIALRTDTQPMTAEVVAKFNHPRGDYSPGRGSFQILENGNGFGAWWEHALQSEYAPDGKLLMEAGWKAPLKSYRSYKFPWVGNPRQPPDVHSQAVPIGDEKVGNDLTTVVYVSWNGATEVKKWNMYKTTPNGETKKLVGSLPRQGFETMLTYEGLASHVLVEAVDHKGKTLGESQVVQTIPPADIFTPAFVEAQVKEQNWMQGHSDTMEDSSSWIVKSSSILGNPIVIYVFGILSCAITVLLGRKFWPSKPPNGGFWWRKQGDSQREHQYDEISDMEEESVDGEEEISMNDNEKDETEARRHPAL